MMKKAKRSVLMMTTVTCVVVGVNWSVVITVLKSITRNAMTHLYETSPGAL